MLHKSTGKPGKQNGKIAVSEIQGTKAGKRNQTIRESGGKPSPAGDPGTGEVRRASRKQR